jgi:hypothetical protein
VLVICTGFFKKTTSPSFLLSNPFVSPSILKKKTFWQIFFDCLQIRFWISRILLGENDATFNCSNFFFKFSNGTFVVCVVFSLSLEKSIFFRFLYFSKFWKEKDEKICQFFHQSLYTREKKQTKQTSWHFFLFNLLFSLYKIISKIPPQKK